MMKATAWSPGAWSAGILAVLVWTSFIIGCAGSHETASEDETFFEPVKAIEQPPPLKPTPGAKGETRSELHARADSLMTVQKNQEYRVQALSDQLQLLSAARRGAVSDSSRAMRKPPSPVAKPAVRTVTLSYEHVLRSYKSGDYLKALDGFQELLKRGVPNNREDDYELLIGVSQYHLNRYADAVMTLKRVVGAPGAKRKGDAYYVLGLAQEKLGDYREARNMFEAVLKQKPGKDLEDAARKKLGGGPSANKVRR